MRLQFHCLSSHEPKEIIIDEPLPDIRGSVVSVGWMNNALVSVRLKRDTVYLDSIQCFLRNKVGKDGKARWKLHDGWPTEIDPLWAPEKPRPDRASRYGTYYTEEPLRLQYCASEGKKRSPFRPHAPAEGWQSLPSEVEDPEGKDLQEVVAFGFVRKPMRKSSRFPAPRYDYGKKPAPPPLLWRPKKGPTDRRTAFRLEEAPYAYIVRINHRDTPDLLP
ncbi:hypothetical protein ACFL2T_01035 [Elusimicrobiota bacterium]